MPRDHQLLIAMSRVVPDGDRPISQLSLIWHLNATIGPDVLSFAGHFAPLAAGVEDERHADDSSPGAGLADRRQRRRLALAFGIHLPHVAAGRRSESHRGLLSVSAPGPGEMLELTRLNHTRISSHYQTNGSYLC